MIRFFIKVGVLFVTYQLAYAGDVQMFQTPPSAEEMGRMLFSKEPLADENGTQQVQSRSISFGKKANESSASKSNTNSSSKSSDNAVGLPIEFAYNSSEISSTAVPFLTEIGKMLTLPDFASKSLVIEGHTDAAGSEDYNLYLSKMRAESIKNYLVNNYRIQSSRLTVRGIGEAEPLPGTDPSDGVNRRVQLRSN